MHAIEIILISFEAKPESRVSCDDLSHGSVAMTRINPNLIIKFFIDLTQIKLLVG
jgi:hypothetical protein